MYKKILSFALLLFIYTTLSAQTQSAVKHFDKVIVSPYIEVTFVEGDKESVTIKDCSVDKSKLHVDVSNNTLWIYLDGAKEIPKTKKYYEDGYKQSRSLYQGTVVTAVVTYKTLNGLSIRGEEKHFCKSPITTDDFSLRIYGESTVIFNELNLNELHTVMYGEGDLEIKSGSIKNQKYTAYGEGKINSLAVNGNTSALTAYGEADFRLNVSDEIKITALGEASVHYKGNPVINKGLHIGDMHIEKIN